MVNRDDYLEMAATRYAELIWKLDVNGSARAQTTPRDLPSPQVFRHAAAAFLRRLADAIQSEGDSALADRLVVTR